MSKDQYFTNNNIGTQTIALDPANGNPYTPGGTSTTAVASGTTTNTVIKASAGRLARVLITAIGTAALSIYDNATTNSGTVLCAIPASAAVGTIYTLDMPAANGITVGGIASSPGITISWS